MLRAKHMGFKSVRRVEVKAETTMPGEARATTDATGARVSTTRSRRLLPKLEFTVDEDGAVLHGPQRGSFPFYATSSANPNVVAPTSNPEAETTNLSAFNSALERDLAASFQALHMRDFPSPPSPRDDVVAPSNPANPPRRSSNDEDEAGCGDDEDQENDEDGEREADATRVAPTPPPPMKECVLNDTRATTLAVKYDGGVGKFVCGSSIERFSGHTGVCRVLGSKKYPVIPHSLRIGDLLRIGSVGLVVCELNRTTSDATQEALSTEQYEFLKENYLSLPLQQTFHPTEQTPDMDDFLDELHDDDAKTNDHDRTMRIGGETSDEGESEEDRKGEGSGGESEGKKARPSANGPVGVAGVAGKRFCYICYDGDEEPDTNPLVAPCHCKGDTKYVHLDCLQRWNNNLDADGTNPNQKVCAVTNTDGLDVCSICKATYLTSVRLEDGRVVSLLAKKLPPPYVTFAVVTQHETRNRSTALTNTRFQLSFAKYVCLWVQSFPQFLTIGRSTTNNMTLRYRTVSQLHAKIKFQDEHFFLFDASSSNGTMLFLSKPLELDWNKTMHVKIGRTILTLKAKKKWKWAGTGAGGDEEEDEATGRASSPRISALNGTPRSSDHGPSSPSGSSLAGIGFQTGGARAISDPSAELVAAPYQGATGQLSRTFTAPNVLSSRLLSRSATAPPNSLSSHQSFASTAPPDLRGAGVSASSHGTAAVPDDELEADEPDPFLTQGMREPVLLTTPEMTYRDFGAESASSPTGQRDGDGGDSVTPQEPPLQLRDRRALYDLVDSFAQLSVPLSPAESGASPVVATTRLPEQQ
ncbi:hypothetical protein BBJ28_00008486 [Nothophytophthora sp. Chile5]|nr:hypothetical protein BBJ28_00008486 [Nothophytophthora sp. Chile5]